eukprot:evm.model.scf_212.4 EVM.evm.TU.scf_212.4   scf_212:31869-39515(+)
MGTLPLLTVLLVTALYPKPSGAEGLSAAGEQREKWQRIGGCSLVPHGRLPYIASVQKLGTHLHTCSGVLIHPSYVITLAKCVDLDSVYSAGAKPLVQIGASNLNNRTNDEVHPAVRQYIHPEWFPGKDELSQYNLALLELENPCRYPVPSIVDDDFKLWSGQPMDTVGYGGNGGKEIPLGDNIFNVMKVEPTNLLMRDICNMEKFWNGKIEPDVFCALNDDRRASCVVDSGSALVYLDQRGIVSLDSLVGLNLGGGACGKPDMPDIFVDLRPARPWIESIITPQCPVHWSESIFEYAPIQIDINLVIVTVVAGLIVAKTSNSLMSMFRGSLPNLSVQPSKPLVLPAAMPAKKVLTFMKLDLEVAEEVVHLGSVIGKGSSGTVREGLLKHKMVAVKEYNNPGAMNPELRVAKMVKHANIVEIFGVGLGEHNFIVMEKMSHNLHFALHDPQIFGNMTYTQALSILLSAARAVAYLHSPDLKIIHRDVKPGNILLDLEVGSGALDIKVVKVNDFDLSKRYPDGTITRNGCGTPRYMAPELWGLGDLDARVRGEPTDVYSLGVVAWEIITGRPDWALDNMPMDQFHGVYPREIIDIVEACTSENPGDRPMAVDLTKDLEGAMMGARASKLTRRISDLMHIVHSNTYATACTNSGGFVYGEVLRILASVAIEAQRFFSTSGNRDKVSTDDILIYKVDGEYGYRTEFASGLLPDHSRSPPMGGCSQAKSIELSQSSNAGGGFEGSRFRVSKLIKGRISSFADVMDGFLLVDTNEPEWLWPNEKLLEGLAHFIEGLRRGEGPVTYGGIADELVAMTKEGGEWLHRKAIPCSPFS